MSRDQHKWEVMTFWRYKFLTKNKKNNQYIDSIKQKILLFDSVRRPHLYAKMLFLRADIESDITLKYNLYNNLILRFTKLHDSLELASVYSHLADIYDYDISPNLDNKAKRLYFYKLIDELFKATGARSVRNKNLINIAATTDDIKEAERIYAWLRRNNTIISDTMAYEMVLRKSFGITDSIEFIDKNIDLLSGNEVYKNTLAFNCAIKSSYLLNKENFIEALKFNLKALELVDTTAPTQFLTYIYWNAANCYYNINDSANTLHFLLNHIYWRDSLLREKDAEAIIRSETTLRIAEVEAQRKLHKQRTGWLAGSIVLVVIVAALIIGFIWYRNSKRKEIQALITKQELEKSQTSLAAYSIVLNEKDRMIEEIEAEISKLKEERKISEEDARDITTVMKIHKSDDMEREEFINIFNKLHPYFYKQLKVDFPSLSESQLHLSAYIASGLTNNHIARLLNIEHSSVNISRYRLRKKFGLQKPDSLEDFLRRYS